MINRANQRTFSFIHYFSLIYLSNCLRSLESIETPNLTKSSIIQTYPTWSSQNQKVDSYLSWAYHTYIPARPGCKMKTYGFQTFPYLNKRLDVLIVAVWFIKPYFWGTINRTSTSKITMEISIEKYNKFFFNTPKMW